MKPFRKLKEPIWQVCPVCKEEVSYLGKDGVCFECEKRKVQVEKVKVGLGELE